MSSVTRGKKRYFSAESPEQLLRLLDIQERELKQKKEDFQKLLPQLKTLFDLAEEKPKVRFFEGIEGLRAMQGDILRSGVKAFDNIISLDDSYRVFPPYSRDHRYKISKKKIFTRTIYTSKHGSILPEKEKLKERRFIPFEKFPFHTEVTIYGNKLAFASLKGKLIGVIIESNR
jgi:sugar-specific transcriptional regulator TrmB